MKTQSNVPDSLENLRVIEQQLEREWWWLQGALNAVAELRVVRFQADPLHFRRLQAQAREVDRRRVQIAMSIAKLEPVRSAR